MDRWLLKLVYEYQGYGITLYVLITTLAAGLLATAIGMERQ